MSLRSVSVSRTRVDVTIVGGGISGLAAAHRLLELVESGGPRLEVRLLEGSERLGGCVRSELEGACLLEAGPDGLLTQKPPGLALVRRLGLESEILHPHGPGSGTWILHRGRLLPLPDGLQLLVPTRRLSLLRSPLLSLGGRLRALAEPFVPPRSERHGEDDESVASFVRRRFGGEMARRIAEPLIGGLYTADVDALSLAATLPRLAELERRYGSLTRGVRSSPAAPAAAHTGQQPPVISLRAGMQALIDGLDRRLPPSWVETGARVDRLERASPGGPWSLFVGDGRVVESTAVVLAVPAWTGAAALRPTAPELARALGELPYASCATASLRYRRADVAATGGGFGFFVPRNAGLPVLACSFSNRKFAGRAPDDTLLLRVFLGGALHPEALDHDDADLLDQAHRSIAPLLGISAPPRAARLFRLPRSMPQFNLGELERRARVTRLVEDQPGLWLCGSAVGAFGLPDCIGSGEAAAAAALRWLVSSERLEALGVEGLSA